MKPRAHGPKAFLVSLTIAAFLLFCLALRASDSAEYFVKLVCESSDRILTVRFDGQKAEIVKQTETRLLASDISGPHGIAFSPDRKPSSSPSATAAPSG